MGHLKQETGALEELSRQLFLETVDLQEAMVGSHTYIIVYTLCSIKCTDDTLCSIKCTDDTLCSVKCTDDTPLCSIKCTDDTPLFHKVYR